MNENENYQCNKCKDKGWVYDTTDKYYKSDWVENKEGITVKVESGTAVLICECRKVVKRK